MPNTSTSSSQHTCVLCNAKLETKEDLQDHFRKHANKEIDGKGRPKQVRANPSRPAVGNRGRAPAASSNAVAAGPSRLEKTEPGNESSTTDSKSTSSPAPKTKKKASTTQPITCDVCNQEFDSVTVAIQHKFRKHPNSAVKHYCPYCGMQFPLKINRDSHLSTHPEPRPTEPFPCKECGVMFYTSQAQTYHFKSTHKRIVAFFKPVVTPPPSKKIRLNNAGEAQSVFYCHLCGYEYIVKFNLQKHLERQHTDDERDAMPKDLIKCTTCDALFYNKKAYENHNMYHKPDDLYVTSEEQRLQTVSRVDQDFDIRRVQATADKFIPVYRPRPVVDLKSKGKGKGGAKNRGRSKKLQQQSSDSELSLDSSSALSSDSDSDEPLQRRVVKRKKGTILKVRVPTKKKAGAK